MPATPTFCGTPPRWNCSVWSPSRNSQFSSAPHFAKPRQHIHGHEYRFVAVKPEQFFGLTEVWVTKQQPIKVSDKGAKHLRRTATARICRRHSRSCQSTLDDEKRNQAELSSRLCPSLRPWGSQAPTRVLRELYKVAPSRQLERLRTKLTSTYERLEPTLPSPALSKRGGACN